MAIGFDPNNLFGNSEEDVLAKMHLDIAEATERAERRAVGTLAVLAGVVSPAEGETPEEALGSYYNIEAGRWSADALASRGTIKGSNAEHMARICRATAISLGQA